MSIVVSEICWPEGIRVLEAAAPVTYDPELWSDRQRLVAALADARALVVRNQTRVNEELLSAAADLAVVGRLGVGLDNLDLEALRNRGVKAVFAGNANALAVAEYALAAMLALARKLPAAHAHTAGGGWNRATFTGGELHGSTLGLIGIGEIGSRVARRARAFGMHVIAFDPYVTSGHFSVSEFGIQLASLEEVLAGSDFVSLHVPLTDETRGLIDADRLETMKPTAVLINTSRGGIVDEAALAGALRNGRLGGAALDVREHEPPGPDDPLADLENVLLTPHVAGLTDEAQVRVCTTVAEDVVRVLSGKRPQFPAPGA